MHNGQILTMVVLLYETITYLITKGAVTCRVRLDRGGYVPGEAISIWATITNSGRVTIKHTRALLTETIQYITRSKVIETETRELSSISRGKIKYGETDDWKNEKASNSKY